MNFAQLKSIFEGQGCRKMYVKELAANDNSKNQVYLGGSFEILNIFPISHIVTVPAGDWARERFKVSIDFSWVTDDGQIYPAPHSQLILYPKYPEVRFSGFLRGCENAPNGLMTQRLPGRLLFFGVTGDGKVLGYVTGPETALANEINRLSPDESSGVLRVIELSGEVNNRERLIHALRQIHRRGWITSRRLDKYGNSLPCDAPHCGGYTLEAELGITPNGYSEPDYLGWEVKQFGVASFERLNSAVITLMTPEPTLGFYKSDGVAAFMHKYGYTDMRGRADRINFGGIYRSGAPGHAKTRLQLGLSGFDTATGKIRRTDGAIVMTDPAGNIAMAWSFADLLRHWNRKHNQACYIPSLSLREPERKYRYGSQVLLGKGTDFEFFLREMAAGNIYYDPAIKMTNVSSKQEIKRRSQFRMVSVNLGRLYRRSEIVRL